MSLEDATASGVLVIFPCHFQTMLYKLKITSLGLIITYLSPTLRVQSSAAGVSILPLLRQTYRGTHITITMRLTSIRHITPFLSVG